LNTGIAIPPKFWNQKKLFISDLLPANYGDAVELNGQLKKLRRKAEDIVSLAFKKKVGDPIRFLNDFIEQDVDIVGIIAILKKECF
jgi:hypothetical protein